jgi:hypothetical protein
MPQKSVLYRYFKVLTAMHAYGLLEPAKAVKGLFVAVRQIEPISSGTAAGTPQTEATKVATNQPRPCQ